MPRAALWDLDGTLIDSEEFHWLAWRDTMAAEGVSISRGQFLATFGRRNDAIVGDLLGRETSAAEIERVGSTKEELYRQRIREAGIAPLPGAREWVERLHQAGWRQAIASSAPRRNVETIMEMLGFERYFAALVSAEDVSRGKPDPEVFLTAASRLGVPPESCVVLEDVAAGIEAARRAGMRSIGVSRAGAPLGADLDLASLADLPPDAFDRLFAPREGGGQTGRGAGAPSLKF